MRTHIPLLVLVLASCMVHERDEDEVGLCIGDHWQVDEVEILEGEPLVAGFASSQCGHLVDAWCELELVGDTIYATTYQEIEHPLRGMQCTEMIMFHDVFCETPELETGSYVLDYAGNIESIDVPSTAEPFCLGPG